MLNLLKKNDECGKFRDVLEQSAGAESVEGLLALLPAAAREHAASCADCRDAVTEFVAVRLMLKKVSASAAVQENPWFAGRVMAAIAAREEELNGPVGTWIALPKLAARLALAACAILLVGSTWIYQRPRNAQGNQPSASSGQEYLFEAPTAAPATQDDVLVSLAENNQ
jgi:hypothetical protein